MYCVNTKKVYEVKGRLGVWTDDSLPTGNLVQKASFGEFYS